eukprot:gene667-482_t
MVWSLAGAGAGAATVSGAFESMQGMETGFSTWLNSVTLSFHACVVFPCSIGTFVFCLVNNYAWQKEQAENAKDNALTALMDKNKNNSARVQYARPFRVLLMVFCYAFGSLGTFMLNKAIINRIAFPDMIVTCQCAFSVIIFTVIQYSDIHFGSFQTTLKWFSLSTVWFAGMLWSSMLALQYTTVSAIYICRNFMPIIVYPIEVLFKMPKTPKPNLWIVLSLVGVAVGTVLFVYPSWNISLGVIAVALLFVNMFVSIVDRIFQRVLLHGHKEAQAAGEMHNYMSTVSCSFVNNAGAAVLLLALSLCRGQLLDFCGVVSNDSTAAVLLASSCFTAASLSYSGIDLQKEITATQMVLTQNGVKCIGVFLGVLIFADQIKTLAVFGVLLNLSSSLSFTFAGKVAKDKAAVTALKAMELLMSATGVVEYLKSQVMTITESCSSATSSARECRKKVSLSCYTGAQQRCPSATSSTTAADEISVPSPMSTPACRQFDEKLSVGIEVPIHASYGRRLVPRFTVDVLSFRAWFSTDAAACSNSAGSVSVMFAHCSCSGMFGTFGLDGSGKFG